MEKKCPEIISGDNFPNTAATVRRSLFHFEKLLGSTIGLIVLGLLVTAAHVARGLFISF